MFTRIRSSRRIGVVLTALAAAAIGFGGALALNPSHAPSPRPELRPAEPGNALAGALNSEAVSAALEYEFFPILWLGEEFQGFRLTEAYERVFDTPWNGEGTRARQFVLLYGDCKPDGDPDHSSCTKPVQVIASGPGLVPYHTEIALKPGWSEVYDLRGARAVESGSGTIVWTSGGAAVTVVTDSGTIRDDALATLRTANGSKFGVSAKDASSLSTLEGLELPQQFP